MGRCFCSQVRRSLSGGVGSSEDVESLLQVQSMWVFTCGSLKQLEMNAQIDDSIYFKSRKLHIRSKSADLGPFCPKWHRDQGH